MELPRHLMRHVRIPRPPIPIAAAQLKPPGPRTEKESGMRACHPRFTAVLICLAALALASTAAASRNAGIAALQVGLHARGYYEGTIDGLRGPATTAALLRFQRKAGLAPTGTLSPATRRALGTYGQHVLGSRALARGAVGWDVAALQFLLAWHGFPSATFDGGLGSHTAKALRKFQRWAGLPADGVAGATTIAALKRPLPRCPLPLAWPLQAPVGAGFGPRGDRFHAGIDLLAGRGTPVGAAASGRVAYAAFAAGGWGKLVVIVHRDGVRTMYAHLSKISVRPGEAVSTGQQVGLVGATGDATGPHLHFEVRLRGAAVDPRTALP
jgi:murein DD-endopeptidase MepM/ murein hydrolase activator NlpD